MLIIALIIIIAIKFNLSLMAIMILSLAAIFILGCKSRPYNGETDYRDTNTYRDD